VIKDSFIVTVGDFLEMHKKDSDAFDPARTRYVIPKYQREYKWNEERVATLFRDINNRDKFLGNIILNLVDDYYEIVDGQQRITTIILFLLALYNKRKSLTGPELSEEQKTLLRFLKHGDHFNLENESIGEYLVVVGNEIEIRISNDTDIYFQRETFQKRYHEISELIQKDGIDIQSLQNKILDCLVMVLVGETGGRRHDSVEEVFLDINFKSQLLDVADIFKGYCFRNFDSSDHESLKELWTEIRRCAKGFEAFGYKNTSLFLYYYLLAQPDGYIITENLSPNGKHYLENKTHTETKAILTSMVKYGKSILDFSNSVRSETYDFVSVCTDAERHRNETNDHQIMRHMLRKIIDYQTAQYYKFPLFMCVYYLMNDEAMRNIIAYAEWKKLVANYYAYSFLFIVSNRSKSKGSIDHTVFNVLYGQQTPQEKVKSIIAAVQALRREYLGSYVQFSIFNLETAYAFYSLVDNYLAPTNFIKQVYSLPDYNQEHLLIHDNKELEIDWVADDRFTFSLRGLYAGSKDVNRYKRQTANYLILPEGLNRTMGKVDIIKKITMIRDYYQRLQQPLPRHVAIFISHIEAMPSYCELRDLKEGHNSEDVIKRQYKAFIDAYFDETQQDNLYHKLEEGIKAAFQGNV